MKIKEARNLKAGDRVYWNDPDEGTCSKWLTIGTIEVTDDGECFISGPAPEYDELECYAHELSREKPNSRA